MRRYPDDVCVIIVSKRHASNVNETWHPVTFGVCYLAFCFANSCFRVILSDLRERRISRLITGEMLRRSTPQHVALGYFY
jgi:hypothetical protein